MWINSSHLAHRWDHLHDRSASCTTFQGVWKILHVCHSPSPWQRDGWITFVTQTSTSVQKLKTVIKAHICGRAEAEGFIHLPRHRQPGRLVAACSFAEYTDMPAPRTASAPEPQASLKSSVAPVWSMLPGQGLLSHQATHSLKEKAKNFVKKKSCKEKTAFSSSLLVLHYKWWHRETAMATIPH